MRVTSQPTASSVPSLLLAILPATGSTGTALGSICAPAKGTRKEEPRGECQHFSRPRWQTALQAQEHEIQGLFLSLGMECFSLRLRVKQAVLGPVDGDSLTGCGFVKASEKVQQCTIYPQRFPCHKYSLFSQRN